MMVMNQYGAMAQRHWQRWLPHRYSQIPDPESFFAELGEEVAARIGDLTLQLAGPDPAGESYLDKVGRLNMARQQAEEIVLREQVLLEPEPGADLDPQDPEDRAELEQAQHDQQAAAGGEWMSTVIEPGHPLFEEVHQQHQELNPPS